MTKLDACCWAVFGLLFAILLVGWAALYASAGGLWPVMALAFLPWVWGSFRLANEAQAWIWRRIG